MSGRLRAYVIAYDIVDDRWRGRVADLLLSYGERVQASVFVVGATPAAMTRLQDELSSEIAKGVDSILICNMGTYDERESKIIYLGKHVNSGLDRDCLII